MLWTQLTAKEHRPRYNRTSSSKSHTGEALHAPNKAAQASHSIMKHRSSSTPNLVSPESESPPESGTQSPTHPYSRKTVHINEDNDDVRWVKERQGNRERMKNEEIKKEERKAKKRDLSPYAVSMHSAVAKRSPGSSPLASPAIEKKFQTLWKD